MLLFLIVEILDETIALPKSVVSGKTWKVSSRIFCLHLSVLIKPVSPTWWLMCVVERYHVLWLTSFLLILSSLIRTCNAQLGVIRESTTHIQTLIYNVQNLHYSGVSDSNVQNFKSLVWKVCSQTSFVMYCTFVCTVCYKKLEWVTHQHKLWDSSWCLIP